MRKLSRTKNSIINASASYIGSLITIVLNFVVRTIFIKVLGASYLGINGLFSDILSMLSLAELGFDTAISYKLYKPISDNDHVKIRQYLKFFKYVYRVVGLIISILGLLMIPFLHYLIADYDSLTELGISAPIIFVLFLLQNVSSYLFLAYRSIVVKACQKGYILNFVGYVITLLSSVCRIGVLLITRNFIAYVITATVFIIIQNLINGVISKKYFPDYFTNEKTSLSKEEKSNLFKDCGALLVYKINNVVLKATDNIVLSTFIGLQIVGLYSNYLVIYTSISTILNQLYSSFKASMGDLFTTDNVKVKYQFFQVTNYLTIILYGVAAVGIAVVSNEVVECWIGVSYVIPQPLPLLIGIEMLFTGLKLNLAQVRNVSGVFRQMWYRPIIGSAINVIVSVVLVQFWNINGVILGTIAAAIFANIAMDPVLIHKHSFNSYKPVSEYYKRNLIYVALLAAVGLVDYYLCANLLVGHGWLSAVVHGVICALSVPLAFILVFWKSHERTYLFHVAVSLFNKKKKG